MQKCTSVAVLLIVLLCTSSAWAESWVLWEQNNGDFRRRPNQLYTKGVFQSQDDCLAAARRAYEQLPLRGNRPIQELENNIGYRDTNDGQLPSFQEQCWPAGVTPR